MWNKALTAAVVLVAFWFTSDRGITHPMAIIVIVSIPIDRRLFMSGQCASYRYCLCSFVVWCNSEGRFVVGFECIEQSPYNELYDTIHLQVSRCVMTNWEHWTVRHHLKNLSNYAQILILSLNKSKTFKNKALANEWQIFTKFFSLAAWSQQVKSILSLRRRSLTMFSIESFDFYAVIGDH